MCVPPPRQGAGGPARSGILLRLVGHVCALGVQGARQVRANSELRAIFVFLAPPSVEELEARLRARGTETDEQVQMRLSTAKQELARQVAAGGSLRACLIQLKGRDTGTDEQVQTQLVILPRS